MVVEPCKAGKNLECSNAGFEYFSLSATSLQTLKYGSWSMAHGIKHGVLSGKPKTSGNELGNAVAIWIDAEMDLPIQSESLTQKRPLQ